MLRIVAFLLTTVICAAAGKPRLIVLTDIGGDPDDTQSMIRLMAYANEFEIEGLIASASGTPGELKQAIVQPQLIRRIVEQYGEVRPSLMRHADGYPSAEALQQRIKSGDPDRRLSNLGAGSDTEGSRWIMRVVDRSDPRPVNVSVWGGAHELAQALWRVRNDRNPAEVERFVRKLRVHSIGHQDETGPWIVENFPSLFFILSSVDVNDVLGAREGKVDRRQSVYRGMYLGGDESLTSREWVDANVRNGHGPLGALYPVKTWTAPNPHGTLKEGDTPSWFYFLPNGLSDPDHPEWGNWGGRFRHIRNRYYNDAREGRESVFRWRPDFQADFAARMDWCTADQAAANHAPTAVLNGDTSRRVLSIEARPGTKVRLSAHGSTDPDRDDLSFRWWHYPQAGGQTLALGLSDDSKEIIDFTVPSVTAKTEIHVVLEVRDNGRPPVVAYRRAVIRVMPCD
jgi:hypothetical protein